MARKPVRTLADVVREAHGWFWDRDNIFVEMFDVLHRITKNTLDERMEFLVEKDIRDAHIYDRARWDHAEFMSELLDKYRDKINSVEEIKASHLTVAKDPNEKPSA